MRAGSPLLTMEFSIGSCSRVAVIMQVSKFFETCTGLHEVRRHSSPPGTPPPRLPMFWTVINNAAWRDSLRDSSRTDSRFPCAAERVRI